MRWTGVAVVGCVLTLAGCSSVLDVFRSEPVLDTGIDPVELAYAGPTYMALDGRDLVVHDGDASVTVPRGRAVTWLPDATALVANGRRIRVADPQDGSIGGDARWLVDPSRAITQVNEIGQRRDGTYVVRSFGLDLAPLGVTELPPTDNPDATTYNELARNYFGAVPTIGGVTFAKWHDGSEWYEDGDYGVARIADGEITNVLINANLVGLYLSADGTGLLGLRQTHGEPCGGCVVDQDIVEIDPATGEIGAEYGVPDEYDEWRVSAIDKVGDRVVVRYYEPVESPGAPYGFDYQQRGTWVYDGAWSMVPGSEEELSWWQGDGRVVARLDPTERKRGDGFDLYWVEGEQETPLPGELATYPAGVPVQGEVAGQLVSPEE